MEAEKKNRDKNSTFGSVEFCKYGKNRNAKNDYKKNCYLVDEKLFHEKARAHIKDYRKKTVINIYL